MHTGKDLNNLEKWANNYINIEILDLEKLLQADLMKSYSESKPTEGNYLVRRLIDQSNFIRKCYPFYG